MVRKIPLLMMVAALGAAGCASPAPGGFGASTTPYYDARFGEAVRQARALQTLNPEAGRHADPVLGIDGPAAASALENYRESFRAPDRTFEVLDLGGSGAGSR
jgi:hypothetical protein